MRPLARSTALAAALLLAACSDPESAGPDAQLPPASDAGSPDAASPAPDAASPGPADAQVSPEPDGGAVPADAGLPPAADAGTDPDPLSRCYSPASFASDAFASDPSYLVDADGYEYMANHEVDPSFAQSLSVALWPLSESTRLTGSFDLAQEPFSYAQCERCVLVIAGRSATDQKHYLAQQGTLVISSLDATKIAGTLADVQLAQVTIDETTLATSRVPGGCTLQIPALSFSWASAVDDRIARCYLPESFASDAFSDYVYDYQASDSEYFYRAIDMPDAAGIPNLTLFVEVYEDGVGTFPLAGAEVNCPSCTRFVIIEAQAPSGDIKTFVSSGGNLVLTELSAEAMVGTLENVTLVETTISGSTFTPVAGGCSTLIPTLAFSSRNATP